jgi:DNA-binding response OmpR family regulator
MLGILEDAMRVLLIEDDRRLLRALRRTLEEERYVVDEASDGVEGEDLARVGAYDFVVLDVMLPRRDGITVCRNLREARVATPVLMLTARDTVADRVTGLDAGADDYLIKPFASLELLARLRSLGRRRTDELSEARLECAGVMMDLVRHEVYRDAREIELTAREFALLEYFLRHPGQALTRTQILAAVWRYDSEVVSNVVDIYVHYLRDKLVQGSEKQLIRTIRGVGYALRP